MATIRTAIELQDNFTAVLYQVIGAVNLGISAMDDMRQSVSSPIDTASIDAARYAIDQATIAARQLGETSIQPTIDTPRPVDTLPPIEAPIEWKFSRLDVFTETGIERFEQEVQSTNAMLDALNQTQAQIAARAAQTEIFPSNMISDLGNMQGRMQAIQQRIQAIENNPLNMGTDIANSELEQLRSQLDQAIQEQEEMNHAVHNMDIRAANEAYLRLSRIVDSTERHIRDNVDEQGRFNQEIRAGTDYATGLKNMITRTVGAFVGITGIRKALSFVQDCTTAFTTQLNAENQLMFVLANMLEQDYVSQFEIETTADTTAAIDEINTIQNSIDGVVVPVSASGRALLAEFDAITAKASDIQSRGIYGDEIMIGAAAEFSTYFSDADAITMMMDTLTDYAMGMTGGGTLDYTAMVDYATNLGKIASGAYDAMTKKGFEFTDAQKAIIEGEATRAQIVATLGEEYISMSEDMQTAAVITQVIDEAWGGLYENMSNTPEGKIIQLNNAWGDMLEVIGGQLYPYVILFVDTINNNWPTIEGIVGTITTGLQYMLGVLSWVLEGAINVAQAIIENWSWIAPIIYGVAAALAFYAMYLGVAKAAEVAGVIGKTILIFAEYAHATMTRRTVSALTAETAAQMKLNTTLLACPIAWIIAGIIVVIAVLYAVVARINKVKETTYSATGIIAGAFMVLAAYIANTFFIPTWNLFAAFANFIGNVFNDPIAAVKVAFYDMCLTVIGYIQNLAAGIETLLNKIPGVTIDITSGLDGFYSDLERAQQAAKDESGWVEYVHKMDYIDYSNAAAAGYSFGQGIEDSVSSFFDPSNLFHVGDIPTPEDYANSFMGSGIGSGIDDTAKNTAATADALDITDEELKSMRDMAEREIINRFTTAELTVNMGGITNQVNSNMDLDGIGRYLEKAIFETLEVAAEGEY